MKLNGKKIIYFCLIICLITVIVTMTILLIRRKVYVVYGEYGLFEYDEECDIFNHDTSYMILDNSAAELYRVSKKIVTKAAENAPGWGEGVILFVREEDNPDIDKQISIILQYSCDDGKLYFHNGKEWRLVTKGQERINKIVSKWCIYRYSFKNFSECNPRNHVYLPYSFFIEELYHKKAYEIDEYRKTEFENDEQNYYSSGPFDNRLENGCQDENAAIKLAMKELKYDEANVLWYYNKVDGSWRIDLMPTDINANKAWTYSEYSKHIMCVIVSKDGEIKAIFNPNDQNNAVRYFILDSSFRPQWSDEGVLLTIHS